MKVSNDIEIKVTDEGLWTNITQEYKTTLNKNKKIRNCDNDSVDIDDVKLNGT